MTTGTDALKIAFRDFLILNVPSSGPNKPFKAEVRAALNILAEDIAAAASGQNIKVNVRSASTANIALSSGLVNGAVIDGVTLATGDRFLVKNQSAPSQNGIYIVAASGAASRATDADTADEVTGMVVIVNEGTAWGGWQFNLLTPAPIVLGATDLNFTPTVNYGEIATSYIQPLLDDAESAAASAAASAAYVIGIDEDIRPKVDQDIVVGGVSDTGENIPRTATAVVSRVRTGGQPLSSGWRGIAAGLLVGTDIDIGAIANSINLDLIASADLTKIGKKVWRRPSDVADINAVPGSSGDVLLFEGDSSVTQLGLIPNDASLIGVRLPIGPVSTGGMASGDVLIIEITGLDDSEDGQTIGFGQFAYGGSPPAHQRGWIMNSSDVWAAYPGTAGPAYTLVFESVNVNSTLARIDGELEAIGDALTSANEVLHDRPAVGSYPISTGYGGVGFALVAPDVTPGDQLYGFATPFQTGPSADSLIVRLMHRPSTVTATLSYFNAGDIELDASIIPLTETNIVAGGPLSYYEHFFPAVWTYPADGFLYVTIEPVDENGEGVACGFGQALQSGWDAERKGKYRSTLASKSWSSMGSFSVPFRLLKKGYSSSGSGADNALRADDVVTDVVATLDGNDVVLSVSLERGGNVTKIKGTVEFTLPTSNTVTGESITLNPSGGSIAYALIPSGGRLDHAAVSDVVVAGYTEGDDYIVNHEQGGIASVVVVEDAAATVNYKWSDIYTDLIVLNRLTGDFEVLEGEGRGADSSEARAVPTGPEQIPICYVRRSHLGLHLGRLYFGAEAYKERLFTNRQRTSKLLSRLSAGLPVNWASYGDSITMIGAPDDSTWYVPNTQYRDIGRAYFSGYLANDIRNAIPVYTSLELFGVDDGAGAVHTKIGLNWEAIDACTERYGSQINYFNMGLGGTTSAATGGVSPIRPNGTNPDRLEALVEVADRLDVVVINFGMNQPSSTTTADEYVTMAEYIRAAHPDCDLIFVGQAKPNDIYRAGDAWEVQNRAIAWAADYVGAAYIDTTLLWGRNDEGGLLGLPAVDVASCGWANHPGLLEFTGMARLLSDTLLLDAVGANKADKSTTVTGEGLLSVTGGTLGVNNTLTVTPATKSEAEAGTLHTVAMTPLRTKEAQMVLAARSVVSLNTEAGGGNTITAYLPTSHNTMTFVAETIVEFRAPATNTGAVTLKVGGVDYPLRYQDGTTALAARELRATYRYLAVYSTTGDNHFRLLTSALTEKEVRGRDYYLRDALTDLSLTSGTYSPMVPLLDRIGMFIDFTDKHSLWQDAAGTIPVKKKGDKIGRVDDKSGNGFHYTATSDVHRPTWITGEKGATGLARFVRGATADSASFLKGVRNDFTKGRQVITTFVVASFGDSGSTMALLQHSIPSLANISRYTVQQTSGRLNVQMRADDSTSTLSYSYEYVGHSRGLEFGEPVLLEIVTDLIEGDATVWSNGYNSPEGVAKTLPDGRTAFANTDENGCFIAHPQNRLNGDIMAIMQVVGEVTPREREGLYAYFSGLADGLTVGDLEKYDPTGPLPVVFFWFNAPNIINLGDDKYLVGGIAAGGRVMAGLYDFDGNPEPQSITHSTLYDFLEVDDHDIPSFVELPDGHIIAMYSRHNRDGAVWFSKTVNAGDPTAWTTPVDVGPQIRNHPTNSFLVSYNFLFRHTGEGGRLYFIHREGDQTAAGGGSILNQEYWCISWSDDDGVTWERSKKLWGPQRPYTRAWSNGVDRIDFFFNDSHPGPDPTNRIHHCYFTGGNFYKSDGTLIGAIGSVLPLNINTDPTLVYDAGPSTDGNSWVWDLTYDPVTGRPVGTYVTFQDNNTVLKYWQARWTGSAWTRHLITPAGAAVSSLNNVYSGGVVTDPSDINTVVCGITVDANGAITSTREGSTYQIFKCVTADGGATWTRTQLTNEEKDAFRPVFAPDSNRVFYTTGEYGPNYTQYVTRVGHVEI